MNRFSKFLPAMAVLGAAFVLATPTPARASYDVEVFDDGVLQGGIVVTKVGNSLLFTGSTTHFDITNGSGLSNNPGSPTGSKLSLSSNELIATTFGAAGGSHTIRIVLSQTDWTEPVGTPLNLTSAAGGSASWASGDSAANKVTAKYQGFLDNTNTLFGEPGAGSTPQQTAVGSNTITTVPLVFAPPTSSASVPGGTPFSMTDDLSFTFDLAAGSGADTANVSASTTATIPEPSTLVLALSALPCLGFGQWLRRRRKSV